MSKLRYLAAGLFSLTLAVSAFSMAPNAYAVDPTLTEASAENTGGTSAKEAGDSVELEFSEATNKFEITEDNIDDILDLNNGHSWLDGAGGIGDADWNSDGDELTIELSGDTSLPTVAVGDTITLDGGDIEDEDGNDFTGTVTITGSFTSEEEEDCDEEEEDCDEEEEDCDDVTASVRGDDEGDEEDEDCGQGRLECNNALQNGKLYKIGEAPTVYLAVRHCVLKPFRGASVFHARGHKFTDVINLGSLPAGVVISGEPALPAEGTLVQGDDATVWFMDHKGKRHGFVSADVFTKLGFRFGQVKKISQSDLNTIATDANISNETSHPDGAVVKCGNSPEVFLVIGGTRFPFPNVQVFEGRGHSFDHIILVDCGRFRYLQGTPITE